MGGELGFAKRGGERERNLKKKKGGVTIDEEEGLGGGAPVQVWGGRVAPCVAPQYPWGGPHPGGVGKRAKRVGPLRPVGGGCFGGCHAWGGGCVMHEEGSPPGSEWWLGLGDPHPGNPWGTGTPPPHPGSPLGSNLPEEPGAGGGAIKVGGGGLAPWLPPRGAPHEEGVPRKTTGHPFPENGWAPIVLHGVRWSDLWVSVPPTRPHPRVLSLEFRGDASSGGGTGVVIGGGGGREQRPQVPTVT